jgi:hypothetical protein
MQSIEHCEQHVSNQADYIQRIDVSSQKMSDASVLHGCQLNSMVVSITDHGRMIQSLTSSVSNLLTLARTTNTAIEEQATQLTNLHTRVRSFEEQVFSTWEQEEPQAEGDQPSPKAEGAQPQTPSFLRGRGQPQTPYH